MSPSPSKRISLPPITTAAGQPPLYQQVIDGLKQAISAGTLPPGSPLPSFRALAEDLLVSLITVKRAYEDLERDGIIYRKQGIGTFVSEDGVEKSRSAQRSEVQERLAQAVADGTALGMTLEELNRVVADIWNRHHAKEERK